MNCCNQPGREYITVNSTTPFFQSARGMTDDDAEKLKKYRHECGCGMGAAFFIASGILYIAYICLMPGAAGIGFVDGAVTGVIVVFVSSIVGKFTGIAIARLRLALLTRAIRANHHAQGEPS